MSKSEIVIPLQFYLLWKIVLLDYFPLRKVWVPQIFNHTLFFIFALLATDLEVLEESPKVVDDGMYVDFDFNIIVQF